MLDILVAAEEILALSAEQQHGMVAGDDGGPTKVFLSQIWLQVGNLTIPLGNGVRDMTVDADHTLFERNELLGQLVPQSDQWFQVTVGELCLDRIETVSAAQSYYRALGRIMLHCMRHGYHIAAHVLPDFYQNYLIRGIGPLSEEYELDDLVHHVAPLVHKTITETKDESREENKMKWMQEFMEIVDPEGAEEATDFPKVFRQAVHTHFIDGYTVALGSLREGITLNGEQQT
jgi:hypothetical protein